ncbi:MAG: rod shape-determining protein MreD [Micavibrio sp. TMED27]|nr:rod shape-determining protein MreD [Micavibrio sp.]OUT90737.1 MAG: rod shape-determining protein MreD [Micavibrio sp. TMED27]|tara:strand:- start:4032 stop:4541 length:510 start_codon:yes stop_codon:yes gene_type:complete
MRAFLTFTERLEIIARMSVPYSFMLLLLLLDVMAAPHPLNFLVAAPFIFMAIHYWSIYRPSMMPAFLVFIVGLFLDFLGGTPLGLHALLYLLASTLLKYQRRFLINQSFMISWLGFVVVISTVSFLQWILMSAFYLAILPLDSLMQPILLGVLFFPLILSLLRLTHKVL